MADFGGTIRFSTLLGKFSVRGGVTHNPVAFSFESVVSHDGSTDRSVKPEAYRFAMELANRTADGAPLPLAELYALENVGFAVLHDHEKVMRIFSMAKLTGDPQVDDMTGTVSGITGVAQGYLEVKL